MAEPFKPKIAAFLEFVADVYATFDPDELTIAHLPAAGEKVRKLRG
jgi:hypothetical protein